MERRERSSVNEQERGEERERERESHGSLSSVSALLIQRRRMLLSPWRILAVCAPLAANTITEHYTQTHTRRREDHIFRKGTRAEEAAASAHARTDMFIVLVSNVQRSASVKCTKEYTQNTRTFNWEHDIHGNDWLCCWCPLQLGKTGDLDTLFIPLYIISLLVIFLINHWVYKMSQTSHNNILKLKWTYVCLFYCILL